MYIYIKLRECGTALKSNASESLFRSSRVYTEREGGGGGLRTWIASILFLKEADFSKFGIVSFFGSAIDCLVASLLASVCPRIMHEPCHTHELVTNSLGASTIWALSYVWHDSQTCVTWHIDVCDMTHGHIKFVNHPSISKSIGIRIHMFIDMYVYTRHISELSDSYHYLCLLKSHIKFVNHPSISKSKGIRMYMFIHMYVYTRHIYELSDSYHYLCLLKSHIKFVKHPSISKSIGIRMYMFIDMYVYTRHFYELSDSYHYLCLLKSHIPIYMSMNVTCISWVTLYIHVHSMYTDPNPYIIIYLDTSHLYHCICWYKWLVSLNMLIYTDIRYTSHLRDEYH